MKSWSPTFVSPACLWATVYVNNLFLCPVSTDHHCIVRTHSNCCLYSPEMTITFERLHCLAVTFLRPAKNLLTWWAPEKKQDASLKIRMHQTKSWDQIKDLRTLCKCHLQFSYWLQWNHSWFGPLWCSSTVSCNISLWKVLILCAKMKLPAGMLEALLL